MRTGPRFIVLFLLVSALAGCASWGRPIGMSVRNKSRFASEWAQYVERPGFKALAVAGNLDGVYVSGWTSDYAEQQGATADALSNCEQRRRDRRIEDRCRVYAIGNEVLK